MYKTETFAKLFFLVSCTGLLMYVVLAFYTFHTAYTAISQVEKFRDSIQKYPSTEISYAADRFINDLKYILVWPVPNLEKPLGEVGQSVFIKYNCSHVNCYITTNKYLLNGDYRNFDAIVFNASILKTWEEKYLPVRRAIKQKYIFYSTEAADSGAMCNICAEDYFNWTWTYKLNSDIRRPFIEVLDKNKIIIAPKDDVRWINNTQFPILSNFVNHNKQTRSLRKAVAIRLQKCDAKKIEFSLKLQEVLKYSSLIADLYGCSFLKCEHSNCSIKKNMYYFYLVYEESFAVDYVTADVVRAYEVGAVPIVIGGANYHKFLPDGSFINAHNKSVQEIATMIEINIDNPPLYLSYHYWLNYYVIRETRHYEGICDLCRDLNNERKFKTMSSYKNFRQWWYSGSLYEKCTIDPDPSEDVQTVLKESDVETFFHRLHKIKQIE